MIIFAICLIPRALLAGVKAFFRFYSIVKMQKQKSVLFPVWITANKFLSCLRRVAALCDFGIVVILLAKTKKISKVLSF